MGKTAVVARIKARGGSGEAVDVAVKGQQEGCLC